MSSGLAKFSSVQAKHARQTVSHPITEGGACFLSSRLLPCLCGNNQREQGLQGFFSCLFSFSTAALCCLVFGYLMPGNSSGCIIFSTHSSIFDPKKCPVCRHRKGSSFAFSYKRSQCLDLESILDQWKEKKVHTCR